jgi:signal transduction histidine kinase
MTRMPQDLRVDRTLTGDELARINRWVLVSSSVRGTVHTVNNILQTISGQAELLGQRPDLPDDARRRIDRIAIQTGRAAELMRELSALGRESSEAMDRADIRLVTERAVALRQYDMAKAQIALEVAGEAGGAAMGAIDVRALMLVLLNLLLNAQQALTGMPDARVILTVGRSGHQVSVTVKDNGPGVPVEDRDRVFEPFYTTRREGATLGLGLTVARLIVEAHAGQITLVGPPNGGSGACVEIVLPAL